jgi:hypothetical protein
VDDGPAQLPSSQIVVEAYLDPFAPFQFGDPDLDSTPSPSGSYGSFSAHSDEAYGPDFESFMPDFEVCITSDLDL